MLHQKRLNEARDYGNDLAECINAEVSRCPSDLTTILRVHWLYGEKVRRNKQQRSL